MNRRELFKGLCAALAAAAIPIPDFVVEAAETYGRSPLMDALPDIRYIYYLNKVQADLLNKIANPPCMLDGHRVIPLPTIAQEEALLHVNRLIEELNGPTKEI